MTTHPTDTARLDVHHGIAERLARLSDARLIDALSRTSALRDGHATLFLDQGERPIFVKLLPLSDLELQRRESTANIFELPAYFHYRMGSCGFSAWRELETHRIANAWVLAGECPRVPLLHHWRVLPIQSGLREAGDLTMWGDSPAIRHRFESIAHATSSLALVIEHLPQTLSAWLQDALRRPEPMQTITEWHANLIEQLEFIHSRGVLHMDAHFDNILMAGARAHLSDFGLSLCRDFDLAADEREFFERHAEFDECTVRTSLVHAAISHYDSRDEWRAPLRELCSGRREGRLASIPPEVREYLIREAPLALGVGEFYGRLVQDLSTPFPGARLLQQARGQVPDLEAL